MPEEADTVELRNLGVDETQPDDGADVELTELENGQRDSDAGQESAIADAEVGEDADFLVPFRLEEVRIHARELDVDVDIVFRGSRVGMPGLVLVLGHSLGKAEGSIVLNMHDGFWRVGESPTVHANVSEVFVKLDLGPFLLSGLGARHLRFLAGDRSLKGFLPGHRNRVDGQQLFLHLLQFRGQLSQLLVLAIEKVVGILDLDGELFKDTLLYLNGLVLLCVSVL